MSNFFSLSKYDNFGYSKFILYENKSSYKTRIGGLISLIIIISIFSYISRSIFMIILNQNSPKVNYSKDFTENSYLNLTLFPIVLKVSKIGKPDIDIEEGITLSAYIKNSDSIYLKQIPIVHCNNINITKYNSDMGNIINNLIKEDKNESNFYCLNVTSLSKLDGVILNQMDPSRFLTISLGFCKKIASYKDSRNCTYNYDNSFGLKIETFIFSDILRLKSQNLNSIIKYTKDNLIRYKNMLLDSDEVITTQVNLRKVDVISSKGYFWNYLNKETGIIVDQNFSDGLVNIYPINLTAKGYAFTILLKGEFDFFERYFDNFLDCFAKIGGLMKFFKSFIFLFNFFYSKLFFSELIEKIVGDKEILRSDLKNKMNYSFDVFRNKFKSNSIISINIKNSDNNDDKSRDLINKKINSDKNNYFLKFLKCSCCCSNNIKFKKELKKVLKSKMDIFYIIKNMFELEKIKIFLFEEKKNLEENNFSLYNNNIHNVSSFNQSKLNYSDEISSGEFKIK